MPPSQEEVEKVRCEKYLNRYWNGSPMVKFLLDALARSNCASPKIKCVPCPETVQATGTFDPDEGIVLCQNFMDTGIQAEDTIAHELIHAYDYCRVQFKKDDCRHNACSEIRAANLSGDCKWSRELFRGKVGKLAGHHKECVRRRAILSLESNPACSGCKDIGKVVDEVFQVCFADTAPFLDIP